MSLYVAELDTTDNENIQDVLAGVEAAAQKAGGEFIESQVTANHNRVFAVLEHDNIVTLRGDLEAAGFKVDELALVRLIGAELEDIKKLKPAGQYLVEWDFPEGLTMDKYLARKKEKSPLYNDIEDVKFLRTYVREDMVKCLCFYDGDSEDAVVAARQVVDTPISRLHKLEGSSWQPPPFKVCSSRSKNARKTLIRQTKICARFCSKTSLVRVSPLSACQTASNRLQLRPK